MKRFWLQYNWKKVILWFLILFFGILTVYYILDLIIEKETYGDSLDGALIISFVVIPMFVIYSEFQYQDKLKTFYSNQVQTLLAKDYKLVWANVNSIYPTDFKIQLERERFVIELSYIHKTYYEILLKVYVRIEQLPERSLDDFYRLLNSNKIQIIGDSCLGYQINSREFRKLSDKKIDEKVNELLKVLIDNQFHPKEI